MTDSNPNHSDDRSAGRLVVYWVGFWLLAIDGVWILFKLVFQDPANLQAMIGTIFGHIIYAAVGQGLCLLFPNRSSRNLSNSVIFWTVYWPFVIVSSLWSHAAGTECINPTGPDACRQMGIFALMLLTPFLLVYFAAASTLGHAVYWILFNSKREQ
jgi:hypothetical protein